VIFERSTAAPPDVRVLDHGGVAQLGVRDSDLNARPTAVARLTGLDGLDELRREWLGLASEVPDSSYFQTPDWVLSWWETLAGEPLTLVATWRSASGRLEAIALLSHVRQPLHRRLQLRVPAWINTGSGAGAADHCGWLALPHLSGAVRRWMLAQGGRHPLLLQSLSPDLGRDLAPEARPVRRMQVPRLLITADSADGAGSTRFRQQLRSKERKLRAAGATLYWIDPSEMHDQVLDSLVTLHQRRWATVRGRSHFGSEDLALHRRLIQRGGPGRGPAAVVAEYAGRPIGILYGFWWRNIFAYYQMGWDPEWARYSPGLLLLREGIRMAAARGGEVFDFLRGTEPVKYRFGVQERSDTTWLVCRGWSGRVLSMSFAALGMIHQIRAGSASPRPNDLDAGFPT
jgi:CelD/BcsL family acetyltransferase involved in cellulose biosynthesis